MNKPRGFSCKADSCVRENKNGNVIRYLSWLVSTQRMQVTNISFGRVGHTHGCLGTLLACVSARLFASFAGDSADVSMHPPFSSNV